MHHFFVFINLVQVRHFLSSLNYHINLVEVRYPISSLDYHGKKIHASK